jgi:hypothetical protein
MRVFNASIEQMLWPEKRERDPVLGNKVPGTIWRTDARSWITIPYGFLPDILRTSTGVVHDLLPQLVDAGGNITIGPIPKGVPVNLLANLQPLSETDDPLQRIAHAEKLVRLLIRLKHDLFVMPKNASDAQLLKVFSNLAKPLLELSKCPDFVVNRGHYFGTSFNGEPGLDDGEKRALIEFLKTF